MMSSSEHSIKASFIVIWLLKISHAGEIIDENLKDINAYFDGSQLTTIIRLFNESIISAILEDRQEGDSLLACLDHGIIRVDLIKQKGAALVGISSEPGYVEGKGVAARFNTLHSMIYLDNVTIVVSDRNNYCLRKIDRLKEETSTLAGNCSEPHTSDTIQDSIPVTDLKFSLVKSLSYDPIEKNLYIVDANTLRVINLDTMTAYEHFTSSNTLHSIQRVGTTNRFLSTTDHGVIVLVPGTLPRYLVGQRLSGDHEGVYNDTMFNSPREMLKLGTDIYLLADYMNNKLKILDGIRLKTSSFCTGEHGSKDGQRSDCQMLQPMAICLIDDDLYIGERGTYGGGIRKLSKKVYHNVEEREPFGRILLIMLGCLVAVVILTLTIVRCYTARAEREEREDEESFVQKIGNLMGQITKSGMKPEPTNQTSDENAEVTGANENAEGKEDNEEIILSYQERQSLHNEESTKTL